MSEEFRDDYARGTWDHLNQRWGLGSLRPHKPQRVGGGGHHDPRQRLSS